MAVEAKQRPPVEFLGGSGYKIQTEEMSVPTQRIGAPAGREVTILTGTLPTTEGKAVNRNNVNGEAQKGVDNIFSEVLSAAEKQGEQVGQDGAEQPIWISNSFSNGNCVELATWKGKGLIRDSKNPNGGKLSISLTDLNDFFESIQEGKFN